jgi:hypothetical protein
MKLGTPMSLLRRRIFKTKAGAAEEPSGFSDGSLLARSVSGRHIGR